MTRKLCEPICMVPATNCRASGRGNRITGQNKETNKPLTLVLNSILLIEGFPKISCYKKFGI